MWLRNVTRLNGAVTLLSRRYSFVVEECHAFEWCGDTPQQRCIPLWLRNVTRLSGAVTLLCREHSSIDEECHAFEEWCGDNPRKL